MAVPRYLWLPVLVAGQLLCLLSFQTYQVGGVGSSRIAASSTRRRDSSRYVSSERDGSSSRNPTRRNRKWVSGTAEEKLLNALFRSYDTDARGVLYANDTVKVTIQLLLLRIQGLDERSQVLSTTGLVITDWQDDRLRWDPSKYSNLSDIVVRPERIWLPELALMNGADEQAPDFKRIRALISSDGHVHWEPGGNFQTTCDIDIRYFPFDEQACPIMIGAWAYYSARMNLTNVNSEIQTHDFKLNGEWDVYLTHAEWKENILPCCPNTRYPYVEFTLYLRRRHTFYVMNIILPCTLLSVLVMIVFCLPPDAGEKISLGISVLLAFTVFLLMVAENVPRTSLHIPIMVVYLTCTMALGTISVCLTVLTLNLHHRDPERSVPRWAKVLVLHYLARIICVKPRKPKTMAERVLLENSAAEDRKNLRGGIRRLARDMHILKPMLHQNNSVDNDGRYPVGEQIFLNKDEPSEVWSDWRELAHVLDRLFFWIVFIFMTASTMIIPTVPLYKEHKSNSR